MCQEKENRKPGCDTLLVCVKEGSGSMISGEVVSFRGNQSRGFRGVGELALRLDELYRLPAEDEAAEAARPMPDSAALQAVWTVRMQPDRDGRFCGLLRGNGREHPSRKFNGVLDFMRMMSGE